MIDRTFVGKGMRFSILILLLVLILLFSASIVYAPGDDDAPAGTAVAAPESASSDIPRFRFVVLGDIHMDYEEPVGPVVPAAIRRIIDDIHPAFVIQMGDVINIGGAGSTSAQSLTTMWSKLETEVINPLVNAGIPFFSTPGNHDGATYSTSPGPSRNKYDEFWSRQASRNPNTIQISGNYGSYYSFNYENSHFISLVAPGSTGLYNPPGHEGEHQAWLESDLQSASSATHIFTFSHSPIRAPALINPATRSEKPYLLNSPSYMPLATANNVEIHFAGHIHVVKDEEFQGIRNVIAGPLGGGRYTLSETGVPSPFAFAIVDVEGEGVEIRRVTWPGFDVSEIPDAPRVAEPLQTPQVPASVSNLGVCPPGTRPVQLPPVTATAAGAAATAEGAPEGAEGVEGAEGAAAETPGSSVLEASLDEAKAPAELSPATGAAVVGALMTGAVTTGEDSGETVEEEENPSSDQPGEASAAPSAGTPAAATGCGNKIAAVGDSLTAGSSSYVRFLRNLCGESTTIKNTDDDPATQSGNMQGDHFAYVSRQTGNMSAEFNIVLQWNPETVILLGGTNDINNGRPWTTIRDNLLSMINRAKERQMRVVSVTVPPYYTAAQIGQSKLDNMLQLNEWIMSAENPADLKVNIHDSLAMPGTHDINPALFAGDRLHPKSDGQQIMAERIHAALTGSTVPTPTGTAAPEAPSAAAPPTAGAPGVSCVPETVLPTILYDFIINSSAGITTIVGIARQNIAVGINKTRRDVSAAAVCQPIDADLSYDIDYFRSTYGRSQQEVEAQLVDGEFMGQQIRVHRLVEPAFGCVEEEIRRCEEANSYGFRSVESYRWEALPEDPELLRTNAFGIAVDINIDTNPNDQSETMEFRDIPDCVVNAFKRFGFKWGGDYETALCPAHFEFMADPNRIVVQENIQCPAGTTLVTVPANSAEAEGASVVGAAPVSSSANPSSLIGNSDFMWPVPESANSNWNAIVSCYGWRNLGAGNNFHDGIDVGVPTGTPLVAIADGTVERTCAVPAQCLACNYAQCQSLAQGKCGSTNCGTCTAEICSVCGNRANACSGFGSFVLLKHADNLYSHYNHLSKVNPAMINGAKVTKGQTIGAVGNSGVSRGSHLHLGIYNERWPRNTGDPDRPESGNNPMCFFPDSILTRLNVYSRNSCKTAFGDGGQVVSSTHPNLIETCANADLSPLAGLTPTPAGSVPAETSPGQPAMVQICRPEAPAPSSEGTVSASETAVCRYCNKGKDSLRAIDSSAACTTSPCCTGPCPPGAVMKDNVVFIGQCTDAMGEGSDCWHDGIQPERPAGSRNGEDYCHSACGVATTRMALKSFGIEKTSRELFCGGPDSVYSPGSSAEAGGGSSYIKIANVAKKAGLVASVAHPSIDWNDIVSNIRDGRVVALLINDYAGSNAEKGSASAKAFADSHNERAFHTGGHFILLYGANDDYVISHDPGRSSPDQSMNIVLSRQYVQRAGRSYAVIG
ncbi:peptidoglycan DD-metalloendopeptidase family protein [Candidatus Woesearchaeota archaeon]|nr:peptidoglycan DD-metalloendopeptidase family protein [Candidatus Woesearchaeota archaeon]